MTTELRKVRRGDPLSIPANTYNTIVDSAADYLRRTSPGNNGGAQGYAQAGGSIVAVRNDSGAAVARYGVLGIDSIVIDPADNLASFQEMPALSCIAPATASHIGQFAIVLAPAASGGIVEAMVAGITPVQINVTDAGHVYADVKDADATQLQSMAAQGGARILWKASGTGTKWALVDVGRSLNQSMFAVRVWRDGGSTDGDKVTQCNRTYTVRTHDATGPSTGGVSLGAAMTPEKRRPATGKLSTPSNTGGGVVGQGYYNPSGAFVLYDANETLASQGCSS